MTLKSAKSVTGRTPSFWLPMVKTPAQVGNCYFNCWRFMWANAGSPMHWVLVQAVITGRRAQEGIRMGHSWVETVIDGKGFVYEPAYDVLVPKVHYYQRCEPSDIRRYDLRNMLRQTQHFGGIMPWTDAIANAAHSNEE